MGEEILTIADVLTRLKGIMGRTKLTAHLQQVPEYEGGPTHRRFGNKIVFREGDYERLLESFECHSKSSRAKVVQRSTFAVPSEDRAYSRALELLTPNKPKPTAPSARRTSGRNRSMVNARS